MSARLAGLSPRALIALAVLGVLVYAAAAWLLVVSPKRNDASRAGEQLAAAESELAQARAAVQQPRASRIRVSDVLRLVKAMPPSSDQPGLVLELTSLAERSGLELRSLSPQTLTEGAGGATMIPVAVTVEGSFREMTRFLQRVRTLVTVRRGKLRATGRLLGIQSVELSESLAKGFPTLDGTITLQAFVYDGPIVPPEAPQEEGADGEPTGGQAASGKVS